MNSGSDQEGRRQLAILHPMKLSVYTLQTTDGNAEHGWYISKNSCSLKMFRCKV